MNTKLVIEIRGGIAYSVKENGRATIEIHDYDVDNCDEDPELMGKDGEGYSFRKYIA